MKEKKSYFDVLSWRGVGGTTVLLFHRFTSFLGCSGPTSSPIQTTADIGLRPPSPSSSSGAICAVQSKFARAPRPLENRFIWFRPRTGAGGGFSQPRRFPAATFDFALPRTLPPVSILLTAEGCCFFGSEISTFAVRLANSFILFLCLIWPMHETFGEVGSGVSNPEFFDFVRASLGMIEIFTGPENPRPGLYGGLWKVTAEAALGRSFMILLLGLDCLSMIFLQTEILVASGSNLYTEGRNWRWLLENQLTFFFLTKKGSVVWSNLKRWPSKLSPASC